MGGPDMLHNDFNAVTLMRRDMDLQYEPPINDPNRNRYELRCLVKEYKHMTKIPDEDKTTTDD